MSTRTTIFAAGILAVALAGEAAGQTATPATAEAAPQDTRPLPTSRRPFRGLFNGNEAGPVRAGLTLRLSWSGPQAPGDLLAGRRGKLGPPPSGNWGGGLLGKLQYGTRPGNQEFNASLTSYARTSELTHTVTNSAHSAQAGFSTALGRTGRLVASQGVSHFPYYQLQLIPELLAPAEVASAAGSIRPDLFLTYQASNRYDTNVSLTHGGPKNRFQYDYEVKTTKYESGPRDTRVQWAGASFERPVSRYRTLHLGYTFQYTGDTGAAPRGTRVHNISLGGTYERPLSFSRRTTVSFSGGSSMIESPNRRLRVLVDAAIQHEIGRTWMLRGFYNQGVQFAEGLADPFYARTVRTQLVGLLNSRTDFSMDAAYARGELQAIARSNPYTSYQGTARLRYAITRGLAAFAESSLYGYAFNQAAQPPPGIAPDAWRRAVRIGVDWWLPLYRPRGSDATR